MNRKKILPAFVLFVVFLFPSLSLSQLDCVDSEPTENDIECLAQCLAEGYDVAEWIAPDTCMCCTAGGGE